MSDNLTVASVEGSAPGKRTASPRAVLAIVGFSVFVAADDLTVVATMLRPMMNDLGLTLPDGLDDAAWIVNVYLIAFVSIMPIAGRLSDVVGRRKVFVAAYLCFIVGTIAIPLTSSLGPFLFARVLTAIGGGAMVPVALAVVGDVYPEQGRARALGTLGAIETMGWVWGPLYGAILVNVASWRWQFWLNVPLAVAGLAGVWWALGDHCQTRRRERVDWVGAAALTIAMVGLNLALLGNAEIQSVTGLDELTGGSGPDFRWLYPVAVAAALFLIWWERRVEAPIIDSKLFAGRNLRIALGVNFIVGAILIIAMVDVPILVNAIEGNLDRSATRAGWILSAMTAAMAITAYVGGRITERSWYGPPVIAGMIAAAVGYFLLGWTWRPETSPWVPAMELALVGTGLGLVIAPTTSAVVDATKPEDRGAAAGLVMVVRLIGLSVGLSALTAYGLDRFNTLRGEIELPAITDPGYGAALEAATANVTADALGDTFSASAVIAVVGLCAGLAMKRAIGARVAEPSGSSNDTLNLSLSSGRGGERRQISEGAPAMESKQQPMSSVEQSDPASSQRWLRRNVELVLGALALLTIGAIALTAVLFTQLSSTQDDLDQTRTDLARVEAGAALYAAQVQGFQEQIVDLEPAISDGLDRAIAGLEEFSASTIEFTVEIDEQVKIDSEIVIDRQLSFPIDESLAIDETLETTIRVDTGIGFDVPIDVTVPISVVVPVQLDLEVDFNETVPISAEVPVRLTLPVAIDVGATDLAGLTNTLANGLLALQEMIAGLGG